MGDSAVGDSGWHQFYFRTWLGRQPKFADRQYFKMAAAAVPSPTVPTDLAAAINPSLTDLTAHSHIYSPPAQLHYNGAVTTINLPYVENLFWTNFKIVLPVAMPRKFTFTVRQGRTILQDNTHYTPSSEWDAFHWPLPSIENDAEPLTVEINYNYCDLPGGATVLPLAVSFAGFVNLITSDSLYLLRDENKLSTYEVFTRPSASRPIPHYHKIDYPPSYRASGGHIIYTSHTYIDMRGRSRRLYSSDDSSDSE